MSDKESLERICLQMAESAGYSADGLASQFGVSIRQLERNFKLAMAQSPKQWLNALRLEAARKLLQDGGSVKEAALSFGYKHPQHFSRDFRKFFGISPSRAHALRPIDSSNCANDKNELV